MGQRHQLFIRIKNPAKREGYFMDEDLPRARKIFGTGKNTVLAFHHQWLYGRAAAVNVANMLRKTHPDLVGDYTPFGNKWYQSLDDWLEQMNMIIRVQDNPIFPRGSGVEGFSFENENFPKMRSHCDYGDNNDGITVIDAITSKYCMMSIYEPDLEYPSGIHSMPKLAPFNARIYMQLYYPEMIGEGVDKDVMVGNIEGNEEIQEEIDTYSTGILTVSELKKIFPAMRKQFQEFEAELVTG